MKRALDILVSTAGLIVVAPILAAAALAVWAQDGRSPLYFSRRMGQGRRFFRMVKLRSMIVGADATGVDSTSANDARVTAVGRFIRRVKLDEVPQLWNVLKGEMSLVGPRPQVEREIALYTSVEQGLLDAKPGVTDFASIVFSDLAEILGPEDDADIAYNQLVRPGKSRLGLFYVAHQSAVVDISLIVLTLVAIVSRREALAGVQALLRRLGADPALVELAGRTRPLVPQPPPGSQVIVTSRKEPAC